MRDRISVSRVTIFVPIEIQDCLTRGEKLRVVSNSGEDSKREGTGNYAYVPLRYLDNQ
jgi:hypothetical protein